MEGFSDRFRGNFILTGLNPFVEDGWIGRTINLAGQRFQVVSNCRRCRMVCVNQISGKREIEPFETLTKKRMNNDGNVVFGVHLKHIPDSSERPFLVKHGYPGFVDKIG